MKLTKQKIKILGMHCTSCAINIDFDLEDLPGIKSAKTSYAKQECEVEFDESSINLQQIFTTIQKTGYDAEAV